MPERREHGTMKTPALVALCATLLLPLPGRASDVLRTYTHAMLAYAPQNFSALRGIEKQRESYRITYGIARAHAKGCASCSIVDEFSWPHHAENWYLNDEWTVPKSWSHEKTASYIVAQLTPSLVGFDRATSGSKEYPTYRWRNAKTKLWVQVDTYNGGFSTRIGHDLAQPLHTLHEATLDEIDALRDAVSNFVKLGVEAGPTDFTSLRGGGKRDDLGQMAYPLTVSFGSSLTECSVRDLTENVLKLDSFSPNWTLECSTTPMVASPKALEAQVLQAVAAALPGGFSTTTGDDLGLNDYRWDDTSTNVAVDIGSLAGLFLPKGLAQVRIGIVHFTH